MIYLDYSATTPSNNEVLETFIKVEKDFFANANSLHKLGTKSNQLIDEATKQIADILSIKKSEVIYTSGATEANNTAIKGIFYKYKKRGKHMITTDFEHSSIYSTLSYLENDGLEVDFVKTDNFGRVDLESLKSLIREDTILVTICSVNSETGIRQPIEEIGKILKEYPKSFFHVDITQSIGKEKVSLENIDLASFSAHKFYGIKGVGVLIKKEKIEIDSLINGGKSTTKFRSGTPSTSLIVSTSKALRLADENLDVKTNKIIKLNEQIKRGLNKYKQVRINSNEFSIPQILNISIMGVKPETFQHALEESEIYVSTQTACSKSSGTSRAVMALTNDVERSKSSIRISISHLTTEEEINMFLVIFDKCYFKLVKEL